MAQKPVLDEKFIGQVFAEIIESTGMAIGYLASALARTVNAERLAVEMRAQIEAAKLVDKGSTAIRIATHVLAALDAEVLIQRDEKSNQTKQ